jgi:hypothetical protein
MRSSVSLRLTITCTVESPSEAWVAASGALVARLAAMISAATPASVRSRVVRVDSSMRYQARASTAQAASCIQRERDGASSAMSDLTLSNLIGNAML